MIQLVLAVGFMVGPGSATTAAAAPPRPVMKSPPAAMTPPMAAPMTTATAADADEDFGDAKVEVVMNVMVAKKAEQAAQASVTASKKSARRSGGLKRLLGRLHIPWVHLPIGWLILLFLIDVGALVFRREGWERWGLYALAGTVLVLVPAVITGLVL
ncbi:MAG: DUF2231 domain-containing protein, partial [bacterium]